MSQPGSSRSVVIQDHQGKRRIVEVVPSSVNQCKSMPSASTKSQEFQYLAASSSQHQQQRLQSHFKSEDSGSQPIVVQQIVQSGSSLPSTSSSGDTKKGMFASSRTATPQKTYIHGPGSLNKLAQSSMTISKRNHSLPSTSASTSAAAYQQNTTVARKRKSDKIGKGLRHFSMKVCEKVEQKGITTYNEVADELVHEEISGSTSPTAAYDQKNIRRRVYDALNVLMAMNIISKEKKEIRWIGLPTNSMRECLELEKENEQRRERIAQKQQQLRDLILQQISYKNLVKRNREAEERGLVPAPNSAIHMPFIILNTHKKTHINCSISNDKSEYSFKFDDNYEIHDDLEVLKQMKLTMGLDTSNCRPEDVERAKQLVPKAFEKFIDMYAQGVDPEDSNGESNEYSSYSQYDDEYSNMSIKMESIETSDVTDDFNHGDLSGDDDDGDSDV